MKFLDKPVLDKSDVICVHLRVFPLPPHTHTLLSLSTTLSPSLHPVDPTVHKGVLVGHTDSVWELVVHPKSATLLSCSADGTCRLWNKDSSNPLISTIAADAGEGWQDGQLNLYVCMYIIYIRTYYWALHICTYYWALHIRTYYWALYIRTYYWALHICTYYWALYIRTYYWALHICTYYWALYICLHVLYRQV